MIRKFKFSHIARQWICNRSNDQRRIFLSEKDFIRFLFLILYCQAPVSFRRLERQVSHFIKHATFDISSEVTKDVISHKIVELNGFAIMPNHFHLLIQEKSEVGVSRYLQRVETAYAKYFNTKYEKRGHLLQGVFRAVPVKTDPQLLYLSAYIHRNPRGLPQWKNKELEYPWSSYQDYAKKNRWGELLVPDIVLNQFSTTQSYQDFVETSTAKRQYKDNADLYIE